LIEALWQAGAKVRVYDPVALHETKRIYGDRPDLVLATSAEDALVGADALTIVTEWQEFRSPDFDSLRAKLKQPVIFDGRNLYDPNFLKQFGFIYYGIGRGASVAVPSHV
jgi:UDPglucose 6-dehydrogenase